MRRILIVVSVAWLVGGRAQADTVTIVSGDGKETNYSCSSKAIGTVCEPVGPVCGGDLRNKECWDAVASVIFPQDPAVSVHLMKLAGCWQPGMLEVVAAINGKAYAGKAIPIFKPELADAYNCCALVAARYAPTFPARRTAITLDGMMSTRVGEQSGPPIALVQSGRDLKCVVPTPHPFDRYVECVKNSPNMKVYKGGRFYFADFVVSDTGSETWKRVDIECNGEELMCTASAKKKEVTCSMASWPSRVRSR